MEWTNVLGKVMPRLVALGFLITLAMTLSVPESSREILGIGIAAIPMVLSIHLYFLAVQIGFFAKKVNSEIISLFALTFMFFAIVMLGFAPSVFVIKFSMYTIIILGMEYAYLKRKEDKKKMKDMLGFENSKEGG